MNAPIPPAETAFPDAAGASPVMTQFFDAKARQPDALIFFRMGDFYELFFEDAARASAAIGITLTHRGTHGGQPIPMAGVPVHAAEAYLAKLIRAGFKVAVCEQMEDPAEARKRGGKSIVRRDIVRVVTPGTLTEDGLLEARGANRLVAVAVRAGQAAVASVELSTGEVECFALGREALASTLAALAPSEILVPDRLFADEGVSAALKAAGGLVQPMAQALAEPAASEARLKRLYGVETLDGFGQLTGAEVGALGLIAAHLEATQGGRAPALSAPRRAGEADVMAIDPATRASLEIEQAQGGGREGSLLAAIDRTITAPGARTLAARLARPLMSPEAIDARLDAVDWLLGRRALRQKLRADAEGRRRYGPRAVAPGAGARRPARPRGAAQRPGDRRSGVRPGRGRGRGAHCPAFRDRSRREGACRPPSARRLRRGAGGGAGGYTAAAGPRRRLRRRRRAPRARRGAGAGRRQPPGGGRGPGGAAAGRDRRRLKVRHNAVLGYFLEASAAKAEPLKKPPLNALFIHRQTMANQVRFTTVELSELDARIAHAGDRALAIELETFEAWRAQAQGLAQPIQAAAAALSSLDVAAALAEWAEEAGAARPRVDRSQVFEAEAARHPVVEAAVRRAGDPFTPNDCRLDAAGVAGARLAIVTGPNMAGKSTFLRQNALLAILAQAGSFVPAKSLHLGVVDRLFSRVGAGDDLARGRSTFMAEMVETAAILTQATPRSFVILDEIGRGTATYDGLAIAWACAEALHDVNRCRALFATHYHELATLEARLAHVGNLSLRAKEWNGELVFLHEAGPGPADRSYGVQVAKLAGVPPAVVARARQVLDRLESEAATHADLAELPLFAAAAAPAAPPYTGPGPVELALAELDLDGMSPREAMDALYRLKGMAR